MKGKTYCHAASDGNEVDVANLSSQFRIHSKEAAKAALAVLKQLGFHRSSLSLVFVSDAMIKQLNQKYLHHSWATDVIAFPFVTPKIKKNSHAQVLPLGEVVISPNQAKVYSKKLGVSLHQELVRYICHGILHLKGYEDHSPKARQAMRKREDKLIKMLERKQELKRII